MKYIFDVYILRNKLKEKNSLIKSLIAPCLLIIIEQKKTQDKRTQK